MIIECTLSLPLCEARHPNWGKELNGVSGCYAAYSADGLCLYVGKAKSLRHRVKAHFINQHDGHGKQWRLAGIVEWFWHRPFAPENAILKIWASDRYHELELELIWHFKPIHNFQVKKGMVAA